MTPTTAIVIMAKAPWPGLAKTRLIPALGAAGAARLAERFLRETVAAALAAGVGPVTLCVTPDAAVASDALMQELAVHTALTLQPQGDGDLGARMQRAMTVAGAHHSSALVIGTDTPALGAALLREAALQLQSHDSVFVPTHDGGYALIGLRQMLPTLFNEMPWSTNLVMSQSRDRLKAAGLSIAELPMQHDIDEGADLVHVPSAWLKDSP
jgi:uncharacterized protein